MAEEKFEAGTTDDQSVLNFLLQRVRGLNIVSTPPLAEVLDDDDQGSDDF